MFGGYGIFLDELMFGLVATTISSVDASKCQQIVTVSCVTLASRRTASQPLESRASYENVT